MASARSTLRWQPGAMDTGLTSLLFWGSLVAALAVAFVVTLPRTAG